MALSIKISDTIRLYFDELVSDTEKKLNTSETRYQIMFDKETSRGFKETLLHIPEYDIEIKYEESKLKSISMLNTEFTNIVKIGETIKSPMILMRRVNQKFMEMTAGKPFSNYIEKLDISTMLCTFEVTFENKKYKVSLSKDGHGNTFIRNIKEVKVS